MAWGHSVFAYAALIAVQGETVRYLVLGVLPVSFSPVFYACTLLNILMWVFGLFLLSKPSSRAQGRLGLAVSNEILLENPTGTC